MEAAAVLSIHRIANELKALAAIQRLSVAVQRALAAALSELGISPSAHRILEAVNHHRDSMRMNQLRTELELTRPNCTAAVQRLQHLGLLDCHPDVRDRRMLLVSLTTEGRQVLVQANDIRLGVLKELFGQLDRYELSQLDLMATKVTGRV